MPTGKASKGTRKLKQRQRQTNRRRVTKGRKPLPFGQFVNQTTRKRRRQEFEAGNDADQSPNKKRKIATEQSTPATPFGFGNEVSEKEHDLSAFTQDMNDGESEEDMSDIDTDLVTTVKRPNRNELEKDNKKLKKSIFTHQKELQALQAADPEFFAHLQENASDMLKFGDDVKLDDMDELDDVVTSEANKRALEDSGLFFDEEGEVEDGDTSGSDADEEDTKMEPTEDAPDSSAMDFLTSKDASDDDADAEPESEIDFDDGGDSDTGGRSMLDGGSLAQTITDSLVDMTAAQLQELIDDLEKKQSLAALRSIMNGFCGFVQMCVIENQSTNSKKKGKADSRTNAVKFNLANNPTMQTLLKYCLCKLAPFVASILDISEKEQKDPSLLSKNPQFQRMQTAFRRYFKNVYAFFNSVTDEAMQRLLLIHSRSLIYILMGLGESVQRLFIKKSTQLWSSGSPTVRIDAFLLLYELGQRLPERQLLKMFKYLYQAYVTVAKRVSLKTMPGINFMINSLVQMYSINPVVSYQDAFHRLRSVAFHVKQAIQTMSKHQSKNMRTGERHGDKLKKNKKQSIYGIYNWRFVNVLRLWAKVLASHANRKNSDLHLLYYPFVQISLSVLNLSRSAMYDPCRLKVIQSMIDLIEACESSPIADRRMFVPLMPHLIQIMDNPAFAKKTKIESQPSPQQTNPNNPKWKKKKEENLSYLDLRFKIKIADAEFNTNSLHAALMDECTRLSILYFSHYSYSIGFAELSFPVQTFIQEMIGNPLIPLVLKKRSRLLSKVLKDNSNWITAKRKSVTFAPKDFDQVNSFLGTERHNKQSPLSKFITTPQYKSLRHLPDAALSNIKNVQLKKQLKATAPKNAKAFAPKNARQQKSKKKTSTKTPPKAPASKQPKSKETSKKSTKSKAKLQSGGTDDILEDLVLSD